MIPDLRQLRYFIAVAEELHFSRAAKRLNIAQPPLSQQIRQLEVSVGTPLFVRSTRNVRLTPAGEVLLEGARRTLQEAERTVDNARRAHRGELQTLRVGFTDASAMSVVPALFQKFRRGFPHVHLELHEDDGSTGHTAAVHAGALDVALLRGPVDSGELAVDVVLAERFVLMVPEKHPFAARRSVPLRLLKGEPIVAFPRRVSPAYYDVMIRMCQDAGFSPNIVHEALRYPCALGLVAAGMGIAFVPRSNRSISHSGVRYCELSGANAEAQIVALYRRENTSVALQELLKMSQGLQGNVSRMASRSRAIAD